MVTGNFDMLGLDNIFLLPIFFFVTSTNLDNYFEDASLFICLFFNIEI